VSAKRCGIEQRAPPIFGRVAITLGIGPHSGLVLCVFCHCVPVLCVLVSSVLSKKLARKNVSEMTSLVSSGT